MRTCKHCNKKLDDSFVDNTCDACWEIKVRTRNISIELLNNILAENNLRAEEINESKD